MLKYSLKRIILALLTAFIILTLTFLMVKSLPFSNPPFSQEAQKYAYFVNQLHNGEVADYATEQEGLGDVLAHFNFDGVDHYFYRVPIIKQYFTWVGNIITKWDWGTSTRITPGADALNIIANKLPVTMSVNIISVLLSVPLGIGLGIFAGLKKNTWIDHTISTLVMIFISIPSFVVITFMIYFLAYKTHLLPTLWPSMQEPTEVKIKAFVIPVLSLSFGSICGYTRFVRAELCEVMSSEYLLLARTKGLTKNQAITRHALRNAFVPILPSILAEFIGIFSGSMILEKLYMIPGIGSLYIQALSAGNSDTRDYPVLMVDMAIFTTVGLLAGILLDLSYGFIDPRIRMGEKN